MTCWRVDANHRENSQRLTRMITARCTRQAARLAVQAHGPDMRKNVSKPAQRSAEQVQVKQNTLDLGTPEYTAG